MGSRRTSGRPRTQCGSKWVNPIYRKRWKLYREDLFAAMGWVETHWQMVEGSEALGGRPRAFGVLALRGDRLERGAALAGVSLRSAREGALGDLVVSPDGALAAYRSDESGTEDIYLRSFPRPGERTIVGTGGGGIPFWSPDGNTLFYGTRFGRWMVAARLQRYPVPRVLSLETLFEDPGIGQVPMPGSTLRTETGSSSWSSRNRVGSSLARPYTGG